VLGFWEEEEVYRCGKGDCRNRKARKGNFRALVPRFPPLFPFKPLFVIKLYFRLGQYQWKGKGEFSKMHHLYCMGLRNNLTSLNAQGHSTVSWQSQ
jgi:hypothetical protein